MAAIRGSFAPQPTLLSELLSATGIGVRLFGRWFPNYGPEEQVWLSKLAIFRELVC